MENETKKISFGGNIEGDVTESSKTLAQRITGLHTEIMENLKTSLEKALEIGELLVQQKECLMHGEFTPWMEKHLPFTVRTANNYMKLYHNREWLKTENVSSLADVYRLLKPPATEALGGGRETEKRCFITLSLTAQEKDALNLALETTKDLLQTSSNAKALEFIALEYLSYSVQLDGPIPIEIAKEHFEQRYGVEISYVDK